MAYPQPFDNTRYTYRYIPRSGAQGVTVPVGAVAAPTTPAAATNGVYYYYPYPCTYSQTYAALAAPEPKPTYVYPQSAYYYTYPTTTTAAQAATTSYYYVPTAAPTEPARTSTICYPQGCGAIPSNYVCGHTRDEVQYEERRRATLNGAYKAKKFKPADAAPDEEFWVREKNGDWHLRPFYMIDNYYNGRWTMDAEEGYLLFERE